MKPPIKLVDGGQRVELHCPKAMPHASTFLWNRQQLLQVNCRGYVVGQHLQPEPAKYSHAPALEQKTFMQPEQPHYAHHPGRFVYIKDAESGELFSAPHEPVRSAPESFVFSAGSQDVYWQVNNLGLEVTLKVQLPLDDAAELWTLTVKNTDSRIRRFELFPCFSLGYMSWMNQSADYSAELGGIVARSITPYQKLDDYPQIKTLKDWTVLLHQVTPSAWEACRDRFEGEGGIHNPDAIAQGKLGNGDALYETPIAALQYGLSLAPNEQQEYRFVFAPVRNADEAQALRETYLAPNGFEEAQRATAAYFAERTGNVKIQTPNADIDQFVNHWLERQVFYHGDVNRLTTDPQTRNYLQDAMGMVYISPEKCREAIVRTLGQQKSDGALPDGVLLKAGGELKYINQIPHTDHCVWLPIVLNAYLNETADYGLLEQSITDQYGETATVLARGSKAMQWLRSNRDERGLSFIAQGDWCDPLNMAGHKGKGVSGWLTIACVEAFKLWKHIADTVAQTALAADMQHAMDEYTNAAQQHLWDGQWFARGISDDGIAFGVKSDQEGKVWLNPQSWALMSGVATPAQQPKIKAAIKDHLNTPYGPVMLAPAYTHMHEHIGRVTQKYPGSAENGSVYNHAAAFSTYAQYVSGEADEGFAAIAAMIPSANDENGLQRGQLPVFVPNYYRGAYKQLPRTAGRSSQLFNTGACSWLFRIIIEQLFGLKGCKDGLKIEPQLPSHWPKATVQRRFRGANFTINMQRHDGLTQSEVLLNGAIIENGIIRQIRPGSEYHVEVRLPFQKREGVPLIVCMGVSGSGKSTYAQKLATELGLRFLDADDFHSDANTQKMQAGTPLDDSDRELWMQSICERLQQHADAKNGCVLAHSGLRKQHREQLRSAGLETLFLHLEAPRETIAQRMAARKDHFMPQALLDSQYEAMQSTQNEYDVVSIDTRQDIDSVTKAACENVCKYLNVPEPVKF